MTLTALTPMLQSDKFEETLQFYTDILGFTVQNTWEEEGKIRWASLSKDSLVLMFSAPTEHLEFNRPIFTGSFYFKTMNVDADWQRLSELAPVCYPIEDFEYGMKEFAIYDPNGYILQFGQPK